MIYTTLENKGFEYLGSNEGDSNLKSSKPASPGIVKAGMDDQVNITRELLPA